MKGTYLLVIELPTNTTIQVGKQGMMLFERGWYGYIGSALNGLDQRIRRHLSLRKKFHWHIDYLLAHATVKQVYCKESMQREECHIAHAFEQALRFIPRFGCSDCACESHLFFGPAKTISQTAMSLHMKLYPLDANS